MVSRAKHGMSVGRTGDTLAGIMTLGPCYCCTLVGAYRGRDFLSQTIRRSRSILSKIQKERN